MNNPEAVPVDPRFIGDHWVLPTDIHSIDFIEAAFMSRLVDAGWGSFEESDDTYKATLVFREALINSVTHGNLGVKVDPKSPRLIFELAKEAQESNPTDKKIVIDLDVNADFVEVSITDEGEGFDWKKTFEVEDESPEALLQSSGRGIRRFIGSYVDSVSYRDDGRKITLFKKRSSPSSELS